MGSYTYSIVIPAYNESQRISASLDKIIAYISEQQWTAEIIVVNDGSRDNTAEIVREYARRNPMVRLLENPGNRGKGYTVRNGVLHANGDIILFTDADLSSPIQESRKLFAALDKGADVTFGSRWLQAELQTERQPLYRQVFGRIFNLLLRIILGLKYKDTQCGFKAFSRKAAHQIFSRQMIDRWGFDPEILFLAEKFGFNVAEVPVEWAHDDRSKINPVVDGFKMFTEMLRVRWADLSGKYDRGVTMYAAS
jgi:glycosyltransferase involved in cell wall biosynthesis